MGEKPKTGVEAVEGAGSRHGGGEISGEIGRAGRWTGDTQAPTCQLGRATASQ